MQTITNITSAPLTMLACNKVDFIFGMKLKNDTETLDMTPYSLALFVFSPRGILLADVPITLGGDGKTGVFILTHATMANIPIGAYKYHIAGTDSNGFTTIYIHGIITIVDTIQHAILPTTYTGTPATITVQLSTNTVILQIGNSGGNTGGGNTPKTRCVVIYNRYDITNSELPDNSTLLLYNTTIEPIRVDFVTTAVTQYNSDIILPTVPVNANTIMTIYRYNNIVLYTFTATR